jgi:uncharacterized membrane protein YczE
VVKSKFPYRFIKLMIGLFLCGLGIAMMVKAGIGLSPWDVLAQGISRNGFLTFGQSTILVSVLVLLLWIPLRVKPGLGSILNTLLLGTYADLVMPFIPHFENYFLNLAIFVLGMLVFSFALGMYVSSNMGKGPRDGLNAGLATRFRLPFWQARLAVELAVVLIGFLLGGQVREGTLLFAVAIGYTNQLAYRIFGLVDKSGRM